MDSSSQQPQPQRTSRSRKAGFVLPLVCVAAVALALANKAVSALPSPQFPASAKPRPEPVSNDEWLNLTVIHTNDVHSRVDPANLVGVSCTAKDIEVGECYGGTARHKTVIDRLRRSNKHSLLLDGGDEFQGTLFYTYFKGNVTAEVMNALGYDVVTIGNHEWDNGPDNLARYWPKLNMPVVCANIDFSGNPELGKLVKPYHIFEDLGVAVIGYITNTTGDISNAGPSVRFLDPIPIVQKYVDELEAKGIKRILAVSHNGYGPDMELAANTHGVDLIVGGHSHSYLGDPKNPNYQGPYPTVIKNLKGENTLIVQAYCWGRYVGHLDVSFNPEGKIVAWDGAPILVENNIPADKTLLERINGWRHAFEKWSQIVLGYATGLFDQESCKQRECTMGNLVADAMLQYARTPVAGSLQADSESDEAVQHVENRPWTDFAFINSGGIRSGLPGGNITVEMIETTSPFGNGLAQIQMTGEEILVMLEAVSVGRYKNPPRMVSSNIQVSGLRYKFNSSVPFESSSHLVDVEFLGYDNQWQKILPKNKYWAVTLDFVLTGGDNILEKKGRRVIRLELLDKVLMDYIKLKETVTPYLDGRIQDVAKSPNQQYHQMNERDEGLSTLWPAHSPQYLHAQYPGGFDEMVSKLAQQREANSGSASFEVAV